MIKSKPVRSRTLKMLQKNIKYSLSRYITNFEVRYYFDKLEVEIKQELNAFLENKVNTILRNTPWIENFIEVAGYDFVDLQQIFEKTKEFYLDLLKDKTFVVRVKRTWNHSFTSLDAEKYVWAWLLKALSAMWCSPKIDLHNPQITVKIEIKESKFFVVKKQTYSVIWGYPTWMQDRVLSLISWGFDSAVSTFSLQKRWAKVDYLFFNLWWKDHELWVKQIVHHLRSNFSIWFHASLIIVDFEEVITELLTKTNHRYRAILLKRLMLKAADQICKKIGYYAIIKWDSLGQVSSQTLINMNVIDRACDTLVFRPLIGYNKQEIVDITKKIWTHDYSSGMPEYCAVVSDKPATAANLEDVLDDEKNIDMNILQKAVDNMRLERCSDLLKDKTEETPIEVIYIPGCEDVIIDVREDLKQQKNPFKYEENTILSIPFLDLKENFAKLDQDKQYLLYCDKWELSSTWALKLVEAWFKNVKVFRPLEKTMSCKI